MNNILNFRVLVCPILAASALFVLTGLTGCKPDQKADTGGGLHEINYDSVKPHLLPLDSAVQYTAKYRQAMEYLAKECPKFKDTMWFGHAESFNADALGILLTQKDSKGQPAAGVRIYYGLHEGKVRMILVPYDQNGNDIITPLVVQKDEKQVPGVSSPTPRALSTQTSGSPGQTIEQGQFCPTVCDNGGSGLNGN